jgi:hypothetical protein
MKEEKAFRECFGWTFYEELLADLVDYSGLSVYDGTQSYVLDDQVLWDGQPYKALVANTTAHKNPLKGEWECLPKFATPCFETLWDGYMRQYLAMAVLTTVAVTNSIRFTHIGTQKNFTDHSVAADIPDVMRWKKEVIGDMDDIFNNMLWHVRKNPDCFGNFGVLDPPDKMDHEECGIGCNDTGTKKGWYGFDFR